MINTLTKRILPLVLFSGISGFAQGGEIVRLNAQNLNLIPKGKETDAMIGDWVMKNDKVIAIIGDAYEDREANQMVSSIQGAVIDFTTLKADNDQLTVFYPQGARIDVPSAHSIQIIKNNGRTIELKVVKNATDAEPFTAETVYSLTDGDEFLKVTTSYKNTGTKPVKLQIYDVLRCDNKLEDITPSGESNMAFVYNKWYDSAYGVLSPERKIYTPSVLLQRNLAAQGHKIFYTGLGSNPEDKTMLNAGQEISVSRMLLTGTDVTDLLRQQAALTSVAFKKISVEVKDKEGNPLGNVFVDARNADKAMVSSAQTNADGAAELLLPAGDFTVEVSKVAHNTLEKPVNGASKLDFTLNSSAKMTFNVSSESGSFIPVKVEFRGINGTKNPSLGPPTRSNGNGNLYYGGKPQFSVELPEGEYQVIVSHGAEYNAHVITTKPTAGKENKIEVKMQRAFTSPNYIIADLHNHTTGSGDSNSGREDRVLNMAASGIEFAPATEHNRISSYTDVIEKLGLKQFIASAAGIELSGRPGPGSINHQIGFPLKVQPEKRGYGAPKTDKNPYVQMKRLYDYDNRSFKLMQQNHPDINQLYFDKDNDGVADKGFGTEEFTDVMEIRESMLSLPDAVNGGNTYTRSFQWLQMLNLGYRIYGTANTDGHTVGNSSGSMFNYIYTANDKPENIDPIEIVEQLKKGRNVMSNGPFMAVTVNNALPGSEIKALDKKAGVKIKILTADWCNVNTVQVLVNGKADPSLTFTKEKNPDMFSDKTEAFTYNAALNLQGDAHIIVLAYGKDETIGLVNGGKRSMPLVLSNPIFVDTGGNGFTPNKDLLGQPLPAKRPARETRPSSDQEE